MPESRHASALWRFRVLSWLVAVLALGVMLWLLGPVLVPFAAGAAVAYLLDPLVCRLERLGMPRALASAGLLTLMIAVLIAGLVLLLPLLATEATTLIRALPGLYENAQRAIAWRLTGLDRAEVSEALEQVFARLRETLTEASPTVFGGLVSGLNGILRALLFWVIMPVVAFYLLMDWQRLLRALDDLLPRPNVHTIRTLASDIDKALAGYVRGVAVVCAILAVYYGSLLTAVGLTYGLLVGVVAGAISFIPYVGAFISGALAIGLALYQFWETPIFIFVVVGIFAFGQFLESQILVPRLVGSSINLHPVWLIFAVMAFGYLFGLAGAIVAVPLAAALGVVVRFGVAEYRVSRLYAGNVKLPVS
ncbi:MAG: AI-2E family transporter [Pararhodobacter sp.]